MFVGPQVERQNEAEMDGEGVAEGEKVAGPGHQGRERVLSKDRGQW